LNFGETFARHRNPTPLKKKRGWVLATAPFKKVERRRGGVQRRLTRGPDRPRTKKKSEGYSPSVGGEQLGPGSLSCDSIGASVGKKRDGLSHFANKTRSTGVETTRPRLQFHRPSSKRREKPDSVPQEKRARTEHRLSCQELRRERWRSCELEEARPHGTCQMDGP